MAAYPNSNQRALMITIEASRLLFLPTRGNLCPTIQQLKACPGLVSGGFEGGARLKQIGLFEMRRLEALSNTIFGVAMTLLAYDLPKASRFAKAPSWIDLVNAYAQPLIALMISFIIAGMFWFSHHRRLVVAPEGSRGEVFLNLIFLLSIIILPVTNGLYGTYRLDSVVAVIYGVHLTFVATLNALLWVLALRGRRNSELLAIAVFPVFALVFATVMAAVAPFVAQFMWCLAFGAPLAGWLAARRWPPRTN
jgi:TMEM175 potassium channel family protein